MQIESRIFGSIEIDDDKIITIPNGLMGFEQYTRYALAFDNEKQTKGGILWLQSVEEPALAFPMLDPARVFGEYCPVIEDEWLAPIGTFNNDEDLLLLNILTVPSDITKMTVNLRAPLIINTITRKGCQLIVNNEEYSVKHKVYELIQEMKKEAE